MSHTSLETTPILEAAREDEASQSSTYESVKQRAMAKIGHSSSSSGAVGGGVRGWSGASSLVLKPKHQQSYRSSTRTSSRFADNNKQLLSIFTVIGLILIFNNFTKMSGVAALPRCPPQGQETDDPANCNYGISSDYCGRKVCAKGPGQICGIGLFKLLGSCGEGLYCNCGRCTGCSLLTMECYDKTCV